MVVITRALLHHARLRRSFSPELFYGSFSLELLTPPLAMSSADDASKPTSKRPAAEQADAGGDSATLAGSDAASSSGGRAAADAQASAAKRARGAGSGDPGDGAPSPAPAVPLVPPEPAKLFGIILRSVHAEKFLPDREQVKRWELRKTNCVIRNPGDYIYILQSGKVQGRTCFTTNVRCKWVECRKINSLRELEDAYHLHLISTKDVEDAGHERFVALNRSLNIQSTVDGRLSVIPVSRSSKPEGPPLSEMEVPGARMSRKDCTLVWAPTPYSTPTWDSWVSGLGFDHG